MWKKVASNELVEERAIEAARGVENDIFNDRILTQSGELQAIGDTLVVTLSNLTAGVVLFTVLSFLDVFSATSSGAASSGFSWRTAMGFRSFRLRAVRTGDGDRRLAG